MKFLWQNLISIDITNLNFLLVWTMAEWKCSLHLCEIKVKWDQKATEIFNLLKKVNFSKTQELFAKQTDNLLTYYLIRILTSKWSGNACGLVHNIVHTWNMCVCFLNKIMNTLNNVKCVYCFLIISNPKNFFFKTENNTFLSYNLICRI